MSTISVSQAAIRDLASHDVAFAPQIANAAARAGLNPRLLAAVAAQETGGPGSNSGSNVVGDGGHGHGVFQIDDRWHAFAKTAAAMNPQANADYAAGMLSGLLRRYGGDAHKALSAYNAGNPNAVGTTTVWQDGSQLGYADSVLRHFAALGGPSNTGKDQRMGFSLGNIVKGVVSGVETLAETGNPFVAAGAGAVTAFSAPSSTPAPTFDPLLDEMSGDLNAGSQPQIYSYMQLAGMDSNGNSQHGADFGSIVDGDMS